MCEGGSVPRHGFCRRQDSTALGGRCGHLLLPECPIRDTGNLGLLVWRLELQYALPAGLDVFVRRYLLQRGQNRSRRTPGGHPKTRTEHGDLFCSFFSPLGRLLGRYWPAPGAVLAPLGSLLGPPGELLGLMLASRGALFGDFEPRGASPEPTSRK